jgi:endonuclease/exonuclease/phosphatase family metal-dependent hydrolase
VRVGAIRFHSRFQYFDQMGRVSALTLAAALRLFGFVTEPWLSNREIHAVVGNPAPAGILPIPIDTPHLDGATGKPLAIVTWNIERGTQYDAILTALRGLDADILLLQEVDRGCKRTGHRDVAGDLADALGMYWVAAGEFQEIGEGRAGRPAITGQAILSRFPIEEARVLRFEAQDRWRWSINPVQPRRGGRMALVARSHGLLLYDTHMESGGNERLQRKQMAEVVADQAREAERLATHQVAAAPVLIAGDFNNGLVGHSPMRAHLTEAAFMDALGEVLGRGPTSRGQTDPIDWIFVKGLSPVTGSGRVVDAHSASDHSPVIAALSTGVALAMHP